MAGTNNYIHRENEEANAMQYQNYYSHSIENQVIPVSSVVPQPEPTYATLMPPQQGQSMQMNTPSSYMPRSDFENYVLQDLHHLKQTVNHPGRLEFENKVIQKLDNLTAIVESLQKDRQDEKDARKKSKAKKKNHDVFQPPSGFPMNTLEEFEKFERADKSEHAVLKRHLEFLGGSNVREALHRYFQATETPELATNFTWTGKTTGNISGKKVLYKTKLISIFFNIIKKNQNIRQLTSDEWRHNCQAVLKSHKQIIINMRNAAKKASGTSGSRRSRREEENELFPSLEDPQPGPSTVAETDLEQMSDMSDSTDSDN